MRSEVCPRCGGLKSARAQICRLCRHEVERNPNADLGKLEDRQAGAIFTLVDGPRILSRAVLDASPTKALEIIAGWIRTKNAAGANWRIRTISTPVTIRRDLVGSRESKHNGSVGKPYMPERNYLARMGMLDLMEET